VASIEQLIIAAEAHAKAALDNDDHVTKAVEEEAEHRERLAGAARDRLARLLP